MITDPLEIAEHFNNFFSEIANNLSKEIKNSKNLILFKKFQNM